MDAEHSIGIHSAERSILDAFRLRHPEGADPSNEALKRWLRQGGQPSEMLRMSRSFARVATAVRQTVEVLL